MSSIHEADWWHRRCDVLETRLRELRAAVCEFVEDYDTVMSWRKDEDSEMRKLVNSLEYELTKYDNDGN